MSSAVHPSVETLQERSAQATRDLCAALGLGTLTPANLKYLAVALMRTATEEVARNPEFGDHLRDLYKSLLPAKPARSPKEKAPKPWAVHLTPIATVDEALLDPYGPPNPFALRQMYGDEQLPLALERYSLTKLKEAIAVVQEQYPDTKPEKITKPGIIEYIVVMVTKSAIDAEG